MRKIRYNLHIWLARLIADLGLAGVRNFHLRWLDIVAPDIAVMAQLEWITRRRRK